MVAVEVAGDRPVDLSLITVGSGKSGSGSLGACVCTAYPPSTTALTVVALCLVQCEHSKLSVDVC